MSNFNSNSDSPAATSPSSAQKHHSRNARKRRTSTTTKLITIIDHNIAFKPKYPDAPAITRPCTECGKKFWSWKALFGHMRCHPERQWRGINPPPNLQRQPPPEIMTQEDHEIAAGLLLLAKGDNATRTPCGSGHQEYSEGEWAGSSGLSGRFECPSCNKVFGSHQALGGHGASHKNLKGCFASDITNDGEDDESEEMEMVLEGHKCSICLRVFSSGQALGGHMRCHWDKGEPEPEPEHEPEPSITNHGALITQQGCGLDLNLPLPAPPQHDSSSPLALELRLGL